MDQPLGDGPKRFGASRTAMEPISVRVPDAIRITGMSRSRIYELIASDEIETVKVGATTLILVASLRSFIERRRRNAQT